MFLKTGILGEEAQAKPSKLGLKKKNNVCLSVVFNPHWGISRTGIIYHVWPQGLEWKQGPGTCRGVTHPSQTPKAGGATPHSSPWLLQMQLGLLCAIHWHVCTPTLILLFEGSCRHYLCTVGASSSCLCWGLLGLPLEDLCHLHIL